MNIKSTLVTVAFALFSTSAVFSVGTPMGEWLTVSPENSWSEYCLPGGSKLDTYHACIQAHPALLEKIVTYHEFRAYLSPDATGFVALYHGPNNGTGFDTAQYQIIMRAAKGRNLDPMVGCTKLDIWDGNALISGDPVHTDQQCGPDPLVLPDFLWK
ncbi:uncharacterized protein SPSC_02294 [Sporisorium scitamineum]|uniref:Mig1 protein n=1 Tax=Sporisorium scitamineum TaxID=49012 RepID=A0A127ZCE7_9BASI|nr:uncharacterized protein SPSC_02294 [Sporisorium scitamineum]